MTTAKLFDGAVTSDKLAAASVTVGKIAAASVTTAELADDAVTTAKFAHGTANTLVGFDASGTPAELSAGSHLTIAGGTIAVVPGSLPSAPLRGSAFDPSVAPTDGIHAPPTALGAGPACRPRPWA